MIKVDCLAAGVLQEKLALDYSLFPELAYSLHIRPANEKQEKVADEIFYTPLTNKQQRNPHPNELETVMSNLARR
jgi:hypothetical protein